MLYARDENDQECLALLLWWLQYISFHINTPYEAITQSINQRLMLESLSSRSLLQKQYHLAVLCELQKASCFLEAGEDPSLVFKTIDSASEVAIKYGVDELQTSILVERGKAHEFYGNIAESIHQYHKVLSHPPGTMTYLDAAFAMGKLAWFSFWNGDRKESFSIINEAKSRFPASYALEARGEWLYSLGRILFEESLHQNDLIAAQEILQRWRPLFQKEPLRMMSFTTQESRLLSRGGKSTQATSLLQTLIDTRDPRSSYVFQKIQAQLQLVDIHLVSSWPGLTCIPLTCVAFQLPKLGNAIAPLCHLPLQAVPF